MEGVRDGRVGDRADVGVPTEAGGWVLDLPSSSESSSSPISNWLGGTGDSGPAIGFRSSAGEAKSS